MLTPFDAPTGADDIEEGTCVEMIEIFHEGAFVPDEAGKYEGAQRIRATFGLPEGSPRRMKLCYYLETFGDITLSAPSLAAAPEQPA